MCVCVCVCVCVCAVFLCDKSFMIFLLASLVYNDSIIIYSVSSLYISYLLHKIFHWWYLSVTYLFLYTPCHRCCCCSCQLFTAKHYNTDWWGAIITCYRYVCMHCWLCSYCHNIAPAILQYSLNAPIAFLKKSSIPRVHSTSPVHSIPHSVFYILPWTRPSTVAGGHELDRHCRSKYINTN